MTGRPKSTTTAKKTTTTKAKTENVAKEPVKTEKVVTTVSDEKVTKVSIPLNYDIPIKSNVQGGLVYVSKKTGYEITWGETGSIEYVEYQDLVAMRNGQRKFFEDNWIIVMDSDDYTAEQILRSLTVDKYYKAISCFETIDDIFDLSIDDILTVVPTFSDGYKENVASRAIDLIRNNDERLDSKSKISALEEVLGIKLTIEEI